MNAPTLRYLEFFAGGGMARAGLGKNWLCCFANDFDPMKVATYTANWGAADIVCEDVAKLTAAQIPADVDLAWASFPCQDLSLAGSYLGLGSAASAVKTRSGTFWPFWMLMRSLKREKRAPRVVVLENVYGALTSRAGKDFGAICSALSGSNYRFGAMVIDARRFVPQSRQRVFFVAVEASLVPACGLVAAGPCQSWHPRTLVHAYDQLSDESKRKWVWWNLPSPSAAVAPLTSLIENDPCGVEWHTKAETERLLEMMTPLNRQKIAGVQRRGERCVGTLYKRTRANSDGTKHQRAEVRFDGLAGCLRTPGGGSSRQTILVVEGAEVRSRLLSPREAARLMGLPDSYVLPERYNDAYHVAGDGVCVSVVRHLAEFLLEPLLVRRSAPQFELALT